jgi:uncharacterized glyoxalase superfamily protein PhnB
MFSDMAAGGMQSAEREQTVSTPATAMRYRDVAAAADWLCAAFGFEKQTVLADGAGRTLYAQLTFGRALLMLAPVGESPIERFMKQPDEIGGAETQSTYFVVGDADAHHAKAKAAGAEIVLPVDDDDFGGRGYTCRDPEGHLWTFGTYDPWQGTFPLPQPAVAPTPPPSGGRRAVVGGVTAVALVAVGAVAWFGGAFTQLGAVSSGQATSAAVAAAHSAALEAAERAAREAGEQLERERAAKAAADKAGEEAQKRAAEAQRAREAAERAVKDARTELERERAKKAAAMPSPDLVKRIEEEGRGREAAERSAREARVELEKERERARKAAETPPELVKRIEEEKNARQAAERAIKEVRAELEKAQSDKTAAEMAKDFALGRAEEEQAAREAAERAAAEVRAELDRQKTAARLAETAPAAVADDKKGASADTQKALANLQKALDKAHKLGADEKRIREDAERALAAARDEANRERTAKNAAWKMVVQLRRQLSQSGQSDTSSTPDDDGPAKRPRKAKKAEE